MSLILKKITLSILFTLILTSCIKFKKVDTREVPISGLERARKNIEEGRGSSLSDLTGRNKGSTNYEFSSSNPMWRASLEILDFLPLVTVDYSGGIIITDWYGDSSTNDSIKITIRFLSNEVQTNSLKIIVHEKKCSGNNNCVINIVDSRIESELRSSILRQAAEFKKSKKK
ncbi:DUF3576 domain-containing protein [Pelagibacteraceae bacterium]|nr:DUF3576 domain-containing protein [Pelagibacteraceae bacterium]